MEKLVNVFIPALNRTATTAIVKQIGLSFYVYDLYDAEGIIAQDRYSAIPVAPFTIDQVEIDQWILDGGEILTAEPTPQQMRDSLQDQIDHIEAQTHMNRFVREAMILISQQQAAAVGLTEPQLYAANIGYKRVKDVDTEIVTLRTQMEGIV